MVFSLPKPLFFAHPPFLRHSNHDNANSSLLVIFRMISEVLKQNFRDLLHWDFPRDTEEPEQLQRFNNTTNISRYHCLNSAGSFWLVENAEAMLFLRTQLLYGRGEIFQTHWSHHLTQEWHQSGEPKVIAFPQRGQKKNTKTNCDARKSQQHGKPRKKAV